MKTANPRQRIENAWRQSASPFPMPKPQRRLLMLGLGVALGVLASRATIWLLTPATPAPAEGECNFSLPELSPEQLQPVMTDKERTEIERWIKRNPGAYPEVPPSPAQGKRQADC